MNCPNCVERMSATDVGGVRSYTCLYCNGIWITNQAIAIMLKLEKSKLNVLGLIAEADGATSENRNCASCSSQPLKLINTNGVEIDACERCGGIYLDDGEVQILLPQTCVSKENEVGKVVAAEGLFWVVLAFFSGGC